MSGGLFDDLEPRSSRTDDTKIIEKLSSERSKLSSGRRNNLADKMEWIRREVTTHLAFLSDKVESCRDNKRLESYFDSLLNSGKGAIDTETTGLDYFNDLIYGWSSWTANEKSIYVPMEHYGYVSGNKLDNQISKEFVSEQLKRVAQSDTKLVFHNAKFDLHMIYHNYGVMLPVWWDTMIASRLLHSSEQDHSLKYQYNVKVKGGKEKPYDFKSLFDGVKANTVPIDIMTPYAAGDTFETIGLQEYQEKEFKKYPGIYNVFKNIEMPLLPIIVEMEETGVAIDFDVLKAMEEKYTTRYEEAKSACYGELRKYEDKINTYRIRNPGKLSEPINLSSPAQIAIVLYDIIKLEPLQKYGRGTGRAVIEHYKKTNKFVEKLADVRDAEKLVNGFIKSIPEYIRDDGRVHSEFVQVKGAANTNNEDEDTGADTGRMASRTPNLQQIPGRGEKSELRKMFKATDGYIMMSSDYSQQEPRLLAHCSNDTEMQQAYRDGKDLYALMASKVYHTSYENCKEFYPDGTVNKEGKKRRSDTKAILLGLMYGRGQASIAEQTGSTLDEAKALIDTFYNEFPNVRKWMNKVEAECEKNGYVETIMGRRRELPDALLPEYEFKNIGGKPKGFNPLDFISGNRREEVVDFTVDDATKKSYTEKLNKAFGWKAKEEIIQQAKTEGIEIKDNSQYKARAKRQSVNTIIQGSAADMSKLAMIYCATNKELRDLGFRMLFPVHDEIIAEAPIQNAKRCGELMSEMMVKAAGVVCPSVPFKCDVELMKNWGGDSYEYDENGNLYVKDKH